MNVDVLGRLLVRFTTRMFGTSQIRLMGSKSLSGSKPVDVERRTDSQRTGPGEQARPAIWCMRHGILQMFPFAPGLFPAGNWSFRGASQTLGSMRASVSPVPPPPGPGTVIWIATISVKARSPCCHCHRFLMFALVLARWRWHWCRHQRPGPSTAPARPTGKAQRRASVCVENPVIVISDHPSCLRAPVRPG